MSDEKLVPVYEADNQVEASIIEGILKENGVDCTLRTVGMAGVFGGGSGSGLEVIQVLARESESKKAEEIILDYQSPDE